MTSHVVKIDGTKHRMSELEIERYIKDQLRHSKVVAKMCAELYDLDLGELDDMRIVIRDLDDNYGLTDEVMRLDESLLEDLSGNMYIIYH